MGAPPRVLFCHCAFADVIDAERKAQIFQRLADSCADVLVVDDLCGAAARKDPALKEWIDAGGRTVVACFPRAVRALFRAAGATLPDDASVLNMRQQSADEIVAAVPVGESAGTPVEAEPADDGWIPWFPVLDAERCTNCRQCMNFCLFGVYGTDADGRVVVEIPRACKSNCPSCARICPAAAIMFPKHDSAPINGADSDAAPGDGPVNVDVAQLLRGDVYETLRRRQQQSAEDCDACGCDCEPSPAERLGIPEDVLAANPQLRAVLDGSSEPSACDCTDGDCCDDED